MISGAIERRHGSLQRTAAALPTPRSDPLFHPVIIDKFGIGPLGPAPRGLILLAREDGHGHWNGTPLALKKPPLYSQ